MLDAAFAKIDRLETITKQNIVNAEELFESVLNSALTDDSKTWGHYLLKDAVEEDCTLSYGIVQPGKDIPNGLPIVRPTDLKMKVIELAGLKTIDPVLAKSYSRTKLKGNDLLLCVRGTTGTVSVASRNITGANVTRGIVPIRFNPKIIDQTFGYYLILSKAFQDQVRAGTYGAALMQINIRDLKKIDVFVPSLSIQCELVERLDVLFSQTQLLRTVHTHKLVALSELRQSLLQKAFAGELVADMPSAEILPFPMKPEGIEQQALHCALVAKTYEQISAGVNDNFFYGRTMAEKTSHMMEAYLGIDLGREAIRGRHGPTDDKARDTIEAYAQENGYFTMQAPKAGGRGYKLIRGQNFDQATALADQYLEPFKGKFNKLMGVIKTMKTRELEVFTTVYAAWNNLLQDKANITDDTIVLAARTNWHEDKERIDRSLFVTAIKTLRQNDMVPTGIGKYVNPIGAQGQERFDL